MIGEHCQHLDSLDYRIILIALLETYSTQGNHVNQANHGQI